MFVKTYGKLLRPSDDALRAITILLQHLTKLNQFLEYQVDVHLLARIDRHSRCHAVHTSSVAINNSVIGLLLRNRWLALHYVSVDEQMINVTTRDKGWVYTMRDYNAYRLCAIAGGSWSETDVSCVWLCINELRRYQLRKQGFPRSMGFSPAG